MKIFLTLFVFIFVLATTVNSKEAMDDTIMCDTYSDVMAVLKSAQAGDKEDFKVVLEYYLLKKATCIMVGKTTKVAVIKEHGIICEVILKNIDYDESLFVACALLQEEEWHEDT